MDTPHPIQAREAAAFSLLDNPFAILGATPRTPREDLAGLAEERGTDAARAALRTVSIPRSRLEAELAFLPGAADRTAPLLAALQRAERPGLDLPPAALANVLAHLCAAGQADADDLQRLVHAQPPLGDAALLDAIGADRAAAGFPVPQPAALPPAQDALAEAHAAALVAACRLGRNDRDAAGHLADLLRAAPDGPPVAFLRRAAAAWARQSATALAATEERAGPALAALLRAPSSAALTAFAPRIQKWATLTAPQRLADARVGLDHDPSLRAVKPWRQAGIQLADDEHPALALHLATMLADQFGDLPGYGVQLREDLDSCRTLAEEKALEGVLSPLRALTERFGAAPAGLLAALTRSGFGPGAVAEAAELWSAFDAACATAAPAEAPWNIVRSLAVRLHNEHDRTDAALALNPGLIARAESAGLSDLAERLRADLRGLTRSVAQQRYRALMDKKQSRKALAQSRILLPLLDDPATRDQVLGEQRQMLQQRRRRWVGLAVIAAIVLLCALGFKLDNDYERSAPYRTAPPRSLAQPSSGQGSSQGSGQGSGQGSSKGDIALPSPAAPPAQPLVPSLRPPPKPAAAAPVKLMLPVRGGPLPEQEPRTADSMHSLVEGRWCEYNNARLDAAERIVRPDQEGALAALRTQWARTCDSPSARRRDQDQMRAELPRQRAKLEAEGRAILGEGSP